MSFELDKDEKVLFEIRRSWFVLFEETIGLLFSTLIPILLISFLESTNYVIFSGNKEILLTIIMLFWIFIVWNIIFIVWTNYYLDIFVVTNKHIIDIEQKNLFVREVAVVNLKNIQDVTSNVDGLLASIIGFGDLYVQSAGEKREFVIKTVTNPELVRSKIKQAIADSQN
jgi:hypothetical protein